MKKIFLALAICLVSCLAVHAQEAKKVFAQIPDSILPFLSPVNRADFIDFLESKMKARVKNKFGNTSEMTDLTSDYIRIQMSAQSFWEMKLLALNDTTRIICAVSTACGPVCDSAVRFYSTDWKQLSSTPYLALPVMDDFFQAPDSAGSDEYETIRLKADMLLAKVELSKENPTLTFTFTTPQYIDKEDADKWKEYLRSPLVYTWEGKFIPAYTKP